MFLVVCVLVFMICQAACDHLCPCRSFLNNCFFSCKDRALERDRPYQRKKKAIVAIGVVSALGSGPMLLLFSFFVRRYANLAGGFALRLACRCSVCCCLFATVGSFLYGEDSFLRPCFAAFDCLSSFKARASELYRPHFGKKNERAGQFSEINSKTTVKRIRGNRTKRGREVANNAIIGDCQCKRQGPTCSGAPA